MKKKTNLDLLRAAITLLEESKKAHEGGFFEAHEYAARARALLAELDQKMEKAARYEAKYRVKVGAA